MSKEFEDNINRPEKDGDDLNAFPKKEYLKRPKTQEEKKRKAKEREKEVLKLVKKKLEKKEGKRYLEIREGLLKSYKEAQGWGKGASTKAREEELKNRDKLRKEAHELLKNAGAHTRGFLKDWIDYPHESFPEGVEPASAEDLDELIEQEKKIKKLAVKQEAPEQRAGNEEPTQEIAEPEQPVPKQSMASELSDADREGKIPPVEKPGGRGAPVNDSKREADERKEQIVDDSDPNGEMARQAGEVAIKEEEDIGKLREGLEILKGGVVGSHWGVGELEKIIEERIAQLEAEQQKPELPTTRNFFGENEEAFDVWERAMGAIRTAKSKIIELETEMGKIAEDPGGDIHKWSDLDRVVRRLEKDRKQARKNVQDIMLSLNLSTKERDEFEIFNKRAEAARSADDLRRMVKEELVQGKTVDVLKDEFPPFLEKSKAESEPEPDQETESEELEAGSFKELAERIDKDKIERDNLKRLVRGYQQELASAIDPEDQERRAGLKRLIVLKKRALDEAEMRLAISEQYEEEAFFKEGERVGLFADLNEDLEVVRKGANMGQFFYTDLVEQRDKKIKEKEGVPIELEGLREAYYRREIDRIMESISAESIASQEEESQLAWLRANLVDLGVANINEDDFRTNPKWVQLRSIVSSPGISRRVSEEFRARVETALYGAHLRSQTSLKEAVRGNDRVPVSRVLKLLEVEEISRAIDFLEASSDITAKDLVRSEAEGRANVEIDNRENSGLRGLLGIKLTEKQRERVEKRILSEMATSVGKPLLPEKNILFSGSRQEKETVYSEIAEQLARSFGEDPSNREVFERYREIVIEALNPWWLLGRPEQKGNKMPPGTLLFSGRLKHFETRIDKKTLGSPEIRARFEAPWMRIRGADGELKGIKPKGLGVDGFDIFSFGRFKKEDLQDMGFIQDTEMDGSDKIELGRDDGGREVPYTTYRHGRGHKEVVVRYALAGNEKDGWKNKTCIEVSNPTAEVMTEVLRRSPENSFQNYAGLLMGADGSREKLEDIEGILNSPLGAGEDVTEEDLVRRMGRLRGEIFGHLDSMAEGRNPGEYHREDLGADIIIGAAKYGYTKEARKSHKETWGVWRAKRVDMMIKAGLRTGLIRKEHVGRIERETLGALPNRIIRGVFGKDASEKPVLKPAMRVFSSIDRFLGRNVDVPIGLFWRAKGVKPFLFWTAIFGFIGEFWNGLTEDLPLGGGSKRRR